MLIHAQHAQMAKIVTLLMVIAHVVMLVVVQIVLHQVTLVVL